MVLRPLVGAALLVLAGCVVGIDLDKLDGGAVQRRDGSAPGSCASDTVEIAAGGRLCVDRTEVSRAAYRSFLAENPSTSGQPSGCRFNSSFTPDGWPPPAGSDALPVTGVDWCDAQAFCAAQGRRLCGPIGGGASQLAGAGDPARSEWATACTEAGAHAYPYGPSFEPGRCNGAGQSSGPAPVGTLPTCSGGYAGLLDLSGNVGEWVDFCDEGPGMSGTNDTCAILGGSFQDGAADLSCASSRSARRSSTAEDRGFRCCSLP